MTHPFFWVYLGVCACVCLCERECECEWMCGVCGIFGVHDSCSFSPWNWTQIVKLGGMGLYYLSHLISLLFVSFLLTIALEN